MTDIAAVTHPSYFTVALWVQIFFAWRIHMLGKWITVPIVIIIVSPGRYNLGGV